MFGENSYVMFTKLPWIENVLKRNGYTQKVKTHADIR